MRARILKPEEWSRINSSDLPPLLPYVRPEDIVMVVVEKDEEIVASVAILRATHFEGLWIKPEERGNAGVFRSLIQQAFAIPRSFGEQFVFGGSRTDDDKMQSICTRLGGQPLPVTFYAMSVGA